MKRLGGFLAAAAVLIGFNAQAATRQWLAPDFFVETPAADAFFVPPLRATVTDCRGQISRAMCVVSSRFERDGEVMSRRCEKEATKYITFFEAVYDRFPPVMQKMFCSIETLSVEADMPSIAYAGLRGGGAVMGFRKSMIDEALDLSTVISWKEQLPFGGERDSYDLAADLPQIAVQSDDEGVKDLAFYVLAHEFGHLFDFANALNTPCYMGGNCAAEPGSFTALSWQTTKRPKASADFPYRRDVCYYDCSAGPLPRNAIAPLYAGMSKTGFITLYAATNIYDDFAESLAFYMLNELGDFTYKLDTRQGAVYDLLGKVHAPVFAEKFHYIEDFLQRPDIAYP